MRGKRRKRRNISLFNHDEKQEEEALSNII
jgi:hypothetical protein